MATKISIVLVDDHHIVRCGLSSFLSAFNDLLVIGEASSGEEALQHIETWLPDVVLMDLLMPGGIDGIEAIHRLHELVPNTKIVVLTSNTDDLYILAALRAGAIGYVCKESDPETLLASVHAASKGQSLLDPAVANVVMQELISVNKHNNAKLTEREQIVLRQLAFGHTNHEIAKTLVVSEETVKTHVGNILTKLHLAHRTQAAIYAFKKGIVSLDEIKLS